MKKSVFFMVIVCLCNCTSHNSKIGSVTVTNTLDIDRVYETVEIEINDLDLRNASVEVINATTNEVLVSQIVDDTEGDQTKKVILFQPAIAANSKATFHINRTSSSNQSDSITTHCFSRFVPERTDDYAWENNKVAFRTFGPKAQQMKEDGVKGGTLTSGIDAWLKRVEYPIIDKWYKKHTSGAGSYHKDTGEGLDNFHVGSSRGVGGIAIKTDSSYVTSKNFTGYKTITNGPIRTSFILVYESWNATGNRITEQKHVTLDYGQNLSHYSIELKGTNHAAVGLTLHKNDGNTQSSKSEGWMSYWEPFEDSELGQGVVVSNPNEILNFDKYVSNKKDQSNFYANLKVSGTLDYYAGFGWKKSKQFANQKEWENYLSEFSRKLKNPLQIELEQ